jgi:O-acetyl-ADP-ribose deacetylase (regulator of RNase III)
MIKVDGNLFDLAENGEFDVVIHGCNCFNTMGGGIAREVRERYPEAFAADAKTMYGDYNKLGNYTECTAGEKTRFTILNCYTQYSMSRGYDVFEYLAFEMVLKKIIHHYGHLRIGMPYIGMGLAGGDPQRVLAIMAGFAIMVEQKGGSVTLVRFA